MQALTRSFRLASVVLFATNALALETDLISGRQIQEHRVPMDTLFFGAPPAKPIRTPDFVFDDDNGTPTARGRDQSGRPWRITMGPAIRGLWSSGTGAKTTYYFAGYTGGAGMAPTTWILAISFNEQRRPVPFSMVTYSSYDEHGIKDLLQLDSTGPVLLQQSWLETHLKADTRSGYYVTTAYRQRGVYWYRTDGVRGSIDFPAFEQWEMMPKTRPHLLFKPDAAQKWALDYGNDPDSGTRTMISNLDANGIHTGPELDCELEFIDVVVSDSSAGREIEAGYFYATEPGTLLPKLGHGNQATITGLNRWPNTNTCSAAVAWFLQ